MLCKTLFTESKNRFGKKKFGVHCASHGYIGSRSLEIDAIALAHAHRTSSKLPFAL